MNLTRRELAAVLTSTAALAQPQPPAPGVEDELKAARGRLAANAGTLARQEVPMATEPAFQFKA